MTSLNLPMLTFPTFLFQKSNTERSKGPGLAALKVCRTLDRSLTVGCDLCNEHISGILHCHDVGSCYGVGPTYEEQVCHPGMFFFIVFKQSQVEFNTKPYK